MTVIKTPDQRVRVFISSTINELAAERRAVREAVSNLRLIPVFFEAGARPHPPRDLYSAYLDQSHVFLGIYWRSYGWVAPGAEISGLEDEYRLSGAQPRLIYVKRAEEREPRLGALLSDIERSDTACYQLFADADELRHLVENDLSVLMSESFESAMLTRSGLGRGGAEATATPAARRVELPAVRGPLVGREVELDAVAALMLRPDARLVTLIGAGGAGKTTLATHVAHAVEDRFPDGALFVSLAPLTDAGLVASTVAEALGVQDSGRQPIDVTLSEVLAGKRLLLVLDNFEQVAEAARVVSDVIQRAPGLRVLVTSRTSLHVRGERLYHLSPLAVPPEGSRPSAEELVTYPSARLFLDRAREVSPGLDLTPENVDAIVAICQRLDGLPLALELAAARTRFFQPAALLGRIGRTLDLVSKGQRDLPERQRTLRAAIEWSYDLLSEDTRRVFRQLGVFRRSWTLEAADVVLGGEESAVDVEEMTERLLDVSLIRPLHLAHSAEPRFGMLQTVHEYAHEALMDSPEAAATTLRYADHFRRLCREAEPHLWGVNSEAWLDEMEREHQNVRAAFHIYVDRGLLAGAWEIFSCMLRYWIARGGLSEGAEWLQAAGIEAFDRHGEASFAAIPPEIQGRTMLWAAFVRFLLWQPEEAFRLIQRAQDITRASGDEVGLAYALATDGCYGIFFGREDAGDKLGEAESIARRLSDPLPLLTLLVWSIEYYRQIGPMDLVETRLEEAARLGNECGSTFALASLFNTRFGIRVLGEDVDWERVAEEAEATLGLIPEKGYKGVLSAALSGLGFARLMQGRLEEAIEAARRAIEVGRESGEVEWVFCGLVDATIYCGKAGRREEGLRLLGAIDRFVADTSFPLVAQYARMHRVACEAVGAPPEDAAGKAAYAEGRRLGLDEAATLAQRMGHATGR